uniref:Chromosome 3 open reading frame 52 n=1 Tax=Salvator merianae TaxID=96440 RepID=A0A8D0DH67_SALMN
MEARNSHVSEQGHQSIELGNLRKKEEEEEEREEEKEAVSTLTEPLNPEAQEKKTDVWRSCFKTVFWKCKLWMIISFIFLFLIFVIILSLILYSGRYIDEDEYWDSESIASGIRCNFSGILKIHCTKPDPLLPNLTYNLLSENLNKRLTDVYIFSPALGRYFLSAEVISFSAENSTASYHLWFSVPPETEEFMKFRMSKTFVMNVLRQSIYDQNEMDIPGCTNATMDPTSVSLSEMEDTEG